MLNMLIAVIAIIIAPTGKASFIHSCMQTRLMGHYNGQQPIGLDYVSKLQITVITPVVFSLISFTCISSTGDLTNIDPYSLQPGFESAGRPGTQSYCLNLDLNVCVVCGRSGRDVRRRSLIPRDYCRQFPPEMKDHHSRDFLLICPKCHCLANNYNGQLRKELAEKYNAPLGMIIKNWIMQFNTFYWLSHYGI